MQRRHRRAQIGVALVGADHDRAGLRHREVGAGHAGFRVEEVGPRGDPRVLAQVMGIVVVRIGAEGAGEHLGDIAAQLVHRRHHDVARRLVVQLLDALAEIRLDDVDPAPRQIRPQFALVGQHRLALDQGLGLVVGQDLMDDAVVLLGVQRPMNMRAVLLGVVLELQEVVRQVGERVLLDGRRQVPEFVPLGHRVALAIALHPQVPQALVVEGLVFLLSDEVRGGFGMVDAFHARAPLRICAMWMNLISRPSRSAHPF